MDSDPELFKMYPMLGEEDYFSSLPDDCLFNVLGLLDRDSFDVMEAVSQKMNFLTRHESFPKCKKGMYDIIIQQHEHGHTLCAYQFEDDEYSLIYTTNGNENGVKRRILGRYKEHYASWQRIVKPTQVPDKLFGVLQELCSKQKHTTVNIIKVRLDESFLRRLLSAFRGKLPFALRLNEVTVDEQVNIADFIIKEKNINPNTRLQSVFDEDFIREFSLFDRPSFKLNFDDYSVKANRVISRDLLPVICRFDYFMVDNATLPGNLLADLIMMGFNTLNEDVNRLHWTFIYEQDINESDLGCFNNEKFCTERTAENFTSSFKITEKLTNWCCEIKYDAYETLRSEITLDFY